MTDRTPPEALRLANEFKLCNEYDSIPSMNDIAKAEAELRRQHAENTTLQQGYDAARLEIDSLQARVQELGAMLRENRSKRIAELEAQLDAIGAGGVEPLRRRECLHQIAEPAAQPAAGWWRQRADEIELEVAQGKSSAMRCYTDMRALLQAAAAPKPEPAAVARPTKTSPIFALRTEPKEGESQWGGIYSNRANAEHDAEVMRNATGREWHVVKLAEASSATVPSTTTEAAAHEWKVSHAYGGEICANCGAVKGTRRGNAPCGEAAAPATQAAPAAQGDAMRYRWLRDMHDWYAEPRIDELDGTKWQLTFYSPQRIEDAMDDDSLDTAIDAARKQGGKT